MPIGKTRLVVLLAALIAWAALFAQPASAESRRIVAVGDLHGDYDAYQAIMSEAKLIDAKGRWAGGETIFVQTGDVPDRGPDSLKILQHLMKLESQARRKGGRVVALIGNHEAMNMTGDLRYVTPGEFAAFQTRKSEQLRNQYFASHREELRARYGGVFSDEGVRAKFEEEVPLGYLEHRTAWNPSGKIGKWILTHDAVTRIDGALFVHGGLSDAYATMTIEEINDAVRDALLATPPGPILTDEAGPLWYRGNIVDDDAAGAEVDRVLAHFEADRLVVGHTPSLEGIRAHHQGKVIQIDTGASAVYGGVRAWLEIENGVVTAHNQGVATQIAPVEQTP
jgi:hypothetical protein